MGFLKEFKKGLWDEIPVFRVVLGMCPTLAVTGSMASAVTMSGCVLFVLVCSNVITSLLRNLVRPHLRILVFTVIIATFVTIVDRLLAAFDYPMSQTLGSYVPLIIVNCIVLCRCEVCASQQSVGPALADAVGQSVGFALGLSSLATVREILGQGTWFNLPVIGENFPLWAIMALPPGAFLTLGLLIGLVNWIGQARSKRAAEAKAPS